LSAWKRYRVRPGETVRLSRWDPGERAEGAGSDKEARESLEALLPKLDRLQGLLWAERRHKVLLVLQGMDTAGKDATIRRVFQGVNPQGIRVAAFGVPTAVEAAHDFLWRVHPHAPKNGEIAIFNRSHYEDVLSPRVHGEITGARVQRRLRAIRGFERLLVEEGTTVVKCFLHLSREEQARRLQARVDDPAKHWKFSVHDLQERPLWDRYVRAYEDLLSRTSTANAPWFVVPSDHPLSRDVVVAELLHRALARLKMAYPPLAPEVQRQLRRYGQIDPKHRRR
jgi:PPK2 family polyphosphate:nucleotide phosphotransferase